MTVDLIIRNVTVVDGTGTPAYSADVVVHSGRVHAIDAAGTAGDDAREVVNGSGLLLTPGFIDIHTHYDAQLLFEPTASPASWHGVTTVVKADREYTELAKNTLADGCMASLAVTGKALILRTRSAIYRIEE